MFNSIEDIFYTRIMQSIHAFTLLRSFVSFIASLLIIILVFLGPRSSKNFLFWASNNNFVFEFELKQTESTMASKRAYDAMESGNWDTVKEMLAKGQLFKDDLEITHGVNRL